MAAVNERIDELTNAIADALDALDHWQVMAAGLLTEDAHKSHRRIMYTLEAALIDDDTLIVLADDGQPTEAQEWRDFDADC